MPNVVDKKKGYSPYFTGKANPEDIKSFVRQNHQDLIAEIIEKVGGMKFPADHLQGGRLSEIYGARNEGLDKVLSYLEGLRK